MKIYCRDCKVELNDHNWLKSLKKQKAKWCRVCRNKYQKVQDTKNKGKRSIYIKKWCKTNYGKLTGLNAKLNKSIPPGVYCVKCKGIIIYVGSSVSPYKRRSCHFSVNKFGGEINNSAVAMALANKEIQRKDLTFEMMDYIDDYRTRKNTELGYINELRPIYNTSLTH